MKIKIIQYFKNQGQPKLVISKLQNNFIQYFWLKLMPNEDPNYPSFKTEI